MPTNMPFQTLFMRCRRLRHATKAVILVCFLIAVLFVFETNVIPTTRRGFFCDDQSIRYPYQHSTIPTWMLAIVFIAIPDAAVIFVELCYYPRNLTILLYALGHFKLSLGMAGILTDVIKCLVGRLRPHFVQVCSPDILVNMTCDVQQAQIYITEYKCLNLQNVSKAVLLDAHKSFPSGHASVAMCSAIFVMLYTWRRAPSSPPHLGRLFLVFMILVGAGAVCGSRVMDYMHHPEDVACGFVVGCVVALSSGYVWWGAMEALEDAEEDRNKLAIAVKNKTFTEFNVN